MLEQAFLSFYPDLLAFSARQPETLNQIKIPSSNVAQG
jgi:hypothetical protein